MEILRTLKDESPLWGLLVAAGVVLWGWMRWRVRRQIAGFLQAVLGDRLDRKAIRRLVSRSCRFARKGFELTFDPGALVKLLGKIFADKDSRQHLEAFTAARLLAELYILDPHPEQDGKIEGHLKRLHKRLPLSQHVPLNLTPGALKQMNVIPLETCFDVKNKQAGLQAYFEQVQAYQQGKEWAEQPEFVCVVDIEQGYLASTFLISGLLSRFEEDWKLVISQYRHQLDLVSERSPGFQDLAEFRAFQFNCWLLWGPSIPICNCAHWHLPRLADRQDGQREIAFQYGFGDESNSFDLLVPMTYFSAWVENKFLSRLQHVCAVPFRAHCSLAWGPHHVEKNSLSLCKAQGLSIVGGKDGKDAGQGEGRMVLTYIDSEPEYAAGMPSLGHAERGNYYSAYIWMMFVIVDAGGAVLFPGKDDGWKNLLPFFEHGNIADASTYLTQKKILAAKAASAIRDILEKNPDIGVAFVGGFDQSLCPVEARRQKDGKLFQPTAEVKPYDRAETLLELFREELRADAAAPGPAARIRLPEGDAPVVADYSTCNLPKHVVAYYKELALAREGKVTPTARRAPTAATASSA